MKNNMTVEYKDLNVANMTVEYNDNNVVVTGISSSNTVVF